MKFSLCLRILWSTFLSLTLLGIILSFFLAHVDFSLNWRTASRASAHLAPLPRDHKNAILQVYAARTYGWRGLLAVHTWLAVKGKNAHSYKVYQVIGWRSFYGLPTLSIENDIPDRYWFGQKPQLIKDLRGNIAAKAINEIERIAPKYPFSDHYIFWPGPNSNTFIADLARKVPELHLSLPPIAIGKDYLGRNKFFARAPSNTGYQLAFYGILGMLLAEEEGLEINILGFIFGISPKHKAIILPGIGYVATPFAFIFPHKTQRK